MKISDRLRGLGWTRAGTSQGECGLVGVQTGFCILPAYWREPGRPQGKAICARHADMKARTGAI